MVQCWSAESSCLFDASLHLVCCRPEPGTGGELEPDRLEQDGLPAECGVHSLVDHTHATILRAVR